MIGSSLWLAFPVERLHGLKKSLCQSKMAPSYDFPRYDPPRTSFGWKKNGQQVHIQPLQGLRSG